MEVERDSILYLVECLADENCWELFLWNRRHEYVCLVLFIDSGDDDKLAKVLVLSEAQLEDALPANYKNFTNVWHIC